MPVIARRRGLPGAVEINDSWRGGTLPALVQGNAGADVVAWLSEHRSTVDDLARRNGAVLFRGFGIGTSEAFQAFMAALSDDILGYGERSSPRHEVTEGVYTSTDHPADQHIALHNEQSYTLDWPLRIVFQCQVEPTGGGRTPLADSRRILSRLTSSTVDRFRRVGVRYVRNYVPGISLSWQEAFQTADRAEAEAYCERNDITWTWCEGDQLRTWQVRPAVHRHPVTGAESWFNHMLFFHNSTLPAEVADGLLAALGEENLPYHTYYGDGQRIEDEVVEEIRAAFAAETVGFDWRQGDVLVVENMLTAHAREPFEGPRKIVVAMADRRSASGGAR
jgi:alpha-ketoglutarate-dependent taurine dioxygenase